jgi:hypothetical protein
MSLNRRGQNKTIRMIAYTVTAMAETTNWPVATFTLPNSPLSSPEDSCSARRICSSTRGPRMTPTISGSTGMPNRRIAKPSRPRASSRIRSNADPLTA